MAPVVPATRFRNYTNAWRVHTKRADTSPARVQLPDDRCNGYKSLSAPSHSYVRNSRVPKDLSLIHI